VWVWFDGVGVVKEVKMAKTTVCGLLKVVMFSGDAFPLCPSPSVMVKGIFAVGQFSSSCQASPRLWK